MPQESRLTPKLLQPEVHMCSPRAVSPLLLSLLIAGGSSLHVQALQAQAAAGHEVAGSLVTVSVEVDGSPAPVYQGLDGSGRYYLEAREGAHYAVSVANRTSERLGVSLVVDGLDAISGERQESGAPWRLPRPGRMYVLEPWDSATVPGWRTSLADVRRFTFVDERASYATRSGKANAKMGWIEVLVYRERERQPLVLDGRRDRVTPAPEGAAQGPPSARRSEPAMEAPDAAAAPSGDAKAAHEPEYGGRAYPGTGWGPRASDPVILVDFEPERRPAERVTLRYEYRDALLALGILPRPWYGPDRLAERERGGDGFAQPPP